MQKIYRIIDLIIWGYASENSLLIALDLKMFMFVNGIEDSFKADATSNSLFTLLYAQAV